MDFQRNKHSVKTLNVIYNLAKRKNNYLELVTFTLSDS